MNNINVFSCNGVQLLTHLAMCNLVQKLIIERVKQLTIQFRLLIPYSSNLATHI